MQCVAFWMSFPVPLFRVLHCLWWKGLRVWERMALLGLGVAGIAATLSPGGTPCPPCMSTCVHGVHRLHVYARIRIYVTYTSRLRTRVYVHICGRDRLGMQSLLVVRSSEQQFRVVLGVRPTRRGWRWVGGYEGKPQSCVPKMGVSFLSLCSNFPFSPEGNFLVLGGWVVWPGGGGVRQPPPPPPCGVVVVSTSQPGVFVMTAYWGTDQAVRGGRHG